MSLPTTLDDRIEGHMNDRNYDFVESAIDELRSADRRIEQLEDALDAANAKAAEWIPVSERLPEDATPVLASNGTDVSLCVYKASQKWWRHIDDYYYWTPTHWMSLPEPPEVK